MRQTHESTLHGHKLDQHLCHAFAALCGTKSQAMEFFHRHCEVWNSGQTRSYRPRKQQFGGDSIMLVLVEQDQLLLTGRTKHGDLVCLVGIHQQNLVLYQGWNHESWYLQGSKDMFASKTMPPPFNSHACIENVIIEDVGPLWPWQ